MLSILLTAVLSQLAPTEAHTGKSGATLFLASPKTSLVATPPTLAVNGQIVALTAGPVSPAFWSFALSSPVNPSDVLRITAPAGWATGAPALDLPVRNSAGRCEYPVPSKPTMGLGVNISQAFFTDGMTWGVPKNWAGRLRPWNWAGATVATFDAQGNPTRLARTSALTPFLSQPSPGQGGLWTLVWDSTDPATRLGLGKAANTGWSIAARPELSSPGNHGVGITSVLEVTQGASTDIGPNLALAVVHPKGTPTYSNLWIIPPGNDLDRSDPLAVDRRILDKLAIGAGKGPSVLRFMDSILGAGGASNIVEPEDLPAPGKTIAGTAPVPITAIQPVTIGATVGTVHGPRPIANLSFGLGGRWLAEALCSAPHGIKTGQSVVIDGLAHVVAGGKAIPAGRQFATAWVTSPTTFIFNAYVASLGQGTVNLDLGMTTPGATVTLPRPPAAISYEQAAAMAAQFDGCQLWCNIPALASDACVDAIAAHVLSRLAPGQSIILEYGNEDWNYTFSQAAYCLSMGSLLELPGGWPEYYQVRRSAECAARFRAAWAAAGRQPADVRLCLAGQFGWMGRPLLTYAASQGVKADVVSGAPYVQLGTGWPAGWAAPAKTWATAQLHDLMRAYLVLDPTPRSWFSDFATAVATYEKAIGRRVQRVAYEGGIETVAGSPWDWASHPDAYDTERVFYAQCQAGGFDGLVYFNMLDTPRPNGNNWGLWTDQGQLAGTGDGRDGRSVNQFRAAMVPGNLSVRGEAWRAWQRDYWLSR